MMWAWQQFNTYIPPPWNEISMVIKQFFGVYLLSAIMLTGCTTLEGPTDPGDPFESYNRSMDSFNNNVDNYVLKPVAAGYQYITPTPVQKGVSNFFSNLDDVLVIFNDLFQLKFKQLASDTGRVLINSTLGLYGLIDWSSDIGLEKHNEDFGQTLGYWGVPRGPYLVLPFFGPSTIRDAGGRYVDSAGLDPANNIIYKGTPFSNRDSTVANSLTVIETINGRAQLLRAGSILDQAALDRYLYIRELYLQRRNNLVFDGNPPKEDWEYYEED
jgi:phospholipid-binding lipoprotein MlaA